MFCEIDAGATDCHHRRRDGDGDNRKKLFFCRIWRHYYDGKAFPLWFLFGTRWERRERERERKVLESVIDNGRKCNSLFSWCRRDSTKSFWRRFNAWKTGSSGSRNTRPLAREIRDSKFGMLGEEVRLTKFWEKVKNRNSTRQSQCSMLKQVECWLS